REGKAEARPAAAGMPEEPGSRRPAVPDRPADPAHLQPGRTRPAAREDPAEDLRPAPLGDSHAEPVRPARLRIHRHQARNRRPHPSPETPEPPPPRKSPEPCPTPLTQRKQP